MCLLNRDCSSLTPLHTLLHLSMFFLFYSLEFSSLFVITKNDGDGKMRTTSFRRMCVCDFLSRFKSFCSAASKIEQKIKKQQRNVYRYSFVKPHDDETCSILLCLVVCSSNFIIYLFSFNKANISYSLYLTQLHYDV